MKLISYAKQITYFEFEQPVHTRFAYGQLRMLPLHDGEFLSELLSAQERIIYEAFGSALSAACWLRGRFAAKHLIQRTPGFAALDCSRLSLISRNDQNQGVVPSVWQDGQQLPMSISISHSAASVLVALVEDPVMRIGVDLVRLGSVNRHVQAAWFSTRERACTCESECAAERVWAAKEAAYKALNQGEGFAPLRFSVELTDQQDCRCIYQSPPAPLHIDVRTWTTHDQHLAAFAARCRA
jgi:phosphopantetheinyl transferase